MAKGSSPILHLIRRLVTDPDVRCCPDKELLRRFLDQQDGAAFETLVRRHGPLVLDVCRGVLFNEADVDDAFQATFLLLAQKAGSIRKTESLASWLHGVAYRMACKARTGVARRKKHEGSLPGQRPAQPDDLAWGELRRVVHEELNALPERHRAPLVLCYLEGKTQDEAAGLLGIAKSTLKERLEHGRALLRARLGRRGLGATALLLVSAWPAVTQAGPAASLVLSTVKAASLVTAGGVVASAVSAEVAALVNGGLNAMMSAKLKVMIVVLVAVSALGATAVGLAPPQVGGPDGPSAPQAQLDDPQTPPSPEEQKAKAADQKSRAQAALRKGPAARQALKAPEDKPGRSDEEALRGTWMAVSGEAAGTPLSAEAAKGYRLTFADGKVTVQVGGKGKRGTFKLDPAAKPKAIDIDLDGGTGVGIYRLDGDTLKLCFAEKGKAEKGKLDRPSKFSTDGESRWVLLVLKKGADEKKAGGAKKAGEKGGAGDEGDSPQVGASKQLIRALEAERDGLKAALKRASEEVDGVLTKVNAKTKTISFTLKRTKLALEEVPLAADAKITAGGDEVALSKLRTGTGISLRVRTDGERTVITAIMAPKPRDE